MFTLVGFIVWLDGSSPPKVYTEQDEGRRHERSGRRILEDCTAERAGGFKES
jgi:hypothetical protein